MKRETDLAEKLFGNKRLETGADKLKTTTIVGKAVSDSENGYVAVEYEGNITFGDEQTNLVPTGPYVKAGDTVLITAVGGTGKSISVTNVQGWGDRVMTEPIDGARITNASISGASINFSTFSNGVITGSMIQESTITGSNIMDSTLTNSLFANGTIEGSKIKFSTFEEGVISGSVIQDSTLEGSKFIDGTIDGSKITDSTIEGSKIKNSTIDGGKIIGSTLTDIPYAGIKDADINVARVADARIAVATIQVAQIDRLSSEYAHISEGVIDNAKIGFADINDVLIGTAQISDAAITTAKIGSAAITTAKIENGAITNSLIQNGAVTNEKVLNLSANKLTAGTIDAAKINVTNLHARNLIVDKLNGQPVIGGYTYISPGSSGYSSKNPSQEGWYEFTINGFVRSEDTEVDEDKAYYMDGESALLYDRDYIDSLEEGLNQRIDGAVETWTGDHVPTLENYPAADWLTDDTKSAHVGDIYFVTISDPTDPDASKDGYNYRFAYDNTQNDYMWVLIKDSDVTKALGEITSLQEFESTTTSWIETTDEGITTLRQNHTALSGKVDKTVKESIQLWFTKANTTAPGKPTAEVTSTSTNGNGWRKVVPAWNASYPNYFYCYQWKFVDNTFDWSDPVRDIAMGETQGMARDAKSTADAALPASTYTAFVQDTFKELVDEVDEQSSTINQMTETMKYGGVNLLPNTGSADGYFASTVPSGDNLAEADDGGVCYTRTLSGTGNGIAASSDVAREDLKQGVKYTMTLMVKSTAARSFALQLRKNSDKTDGGSYWTTAAIDVPANTWTKLEGTITVGSEDQSVYARLYYAAGTACTIYVRNWQLERGEIATEWNPSSLDLHEVSNVVNQVKQTADQNLASITGLTTTTEKLREDLDGIEVGGRNLLSNRESFSKVANGLTFEYNEDSHILHISGTNTKTDSVWTMANVVNDVITTALIPGEDYTLTGYDLGGFFDTDLYAQLNTYITTGSQVGDWSVGKERRYPSHTNAVRENYDYRDGWANLFIGVPVTVGTIDVQIRFKFEKGNKATDWTPAPEDVTEAIDKLSTTTTSKYNTLEQTLDGTISTVGAIVDASVTGTNLLTGNAANPFNWTVQAPEGANFTKTAYGTAGAKITFDTVSGYENLYSPAISVENGHTYTLSVEYTVGKEFELLASAAGAYEGYGLAAYNKTGYPGNGSDKTASLGCLGKAVFMTGASSVKMRASVTFTALSDSVVLMLNGGQIADGFSGLSFTIDNIKLVENFSSRLTTAETAIEQNASDIVLRATKTEASQMAQPNLSPILTYDSYPTAAIADNASGYWTYWSSGCVGNVTRLDDGWAHYDYNNTGSSTVRVEFAVEKSPDVKPGTLYTFLIEIRNFSSTSTTSSPFYLVQSNNKQFWGGDAAEVLEDTSATSGTSTYIQFVKGKPSSMLRRYTKMSEAEGSTHWTDGSSANVKGLMMYTCNVPAGARVVFDVRMSIYEGEYMGPYKPYTGTQLYASQAELKVANDEISAKVSKDGVIASINASVEQSGGSAVKISADKVAITGAAIFNALGSDKKVITSSTPQWYSSTSRSSLAGGSWATTQPSTADGRYIWQRTYHTYSDGTNGYTPNSTGVCITSEADISSVATEKALGYANGMVLRTHTPTAYVAYDFDVAEELQPSQPYILRLWDVDVAHSGKTAETLAVDVYYCGGSVRLGGWTGTEYFTNGHADYLELRFTPSNEGPGPTSAGVATNSISNSTVVNTEKKFIRLYNSVPDATGTKNMSIGKWQLEKDVATSSGVNLVGYSGTYKNWQKATDVTFVDDVVDINVSGATSNQFRRAYGFLTESDIVDGPFVLSFEVYSDDWSSVTSDMATGLASASLQMCYYDIDKWTMPSGAKRYMYGSLGQHRYWAVMPEQEDGKWLRFESAPLYPPTFPSDAAKGVGKELTVEPMLRRNGHVKFRKIKLERGTKASDWTPAPSDVEEALEELPGFHYLSSAYTNPIATIQNWAAEGNNAGNWDVTSTEGVKVGDTAYVKTVPSDNAGFAVYVILTVTAVDSATRLHGISHGFVNTRPTQNTAYQGTLSTGGSTAAKVANCPGFVLAAGATVSLYCASSGHNVSGALTLNVNSTGAIPIWVAGEATSDTNRLYWTYGCTLSFTYDGEHWRLMDKPPSFMTDTCSTAAGTAAKVATADSFVLFRGATYTVPMTHANTSSSATLQIQNSGSTKHPACPIYFGTGTDVPTKANGLGWPDGAAVIFTFDGKFWRTGNQTFIDGGNVVTGKVAAERIDVANINIGDLGGELGGRNLLAYEDIYCYSSAQNTYLNKASYINEGTVTYARTAVKNEGFYITNSAKQSTGTTYTVHFDITDTAKKVTKIHIYSDGGKLIGGLSSNVDVYIDGSNLGHADSSLACDLTGGATKHVMVKYVCKGASSSSYKGLILQAHKDTAEAFNITVANLKWERGGMETDWSPAESDVSAEIAALEAAKGSYTILWNYSDFATANNGEAYICKQDPRTHSLSDVNGSVVWNGVERTIPKGMVNPNTVHPYNIPTYVVCRLTSATATTGTNYIVHYNSGWKGGTINAGALSDWTWNVDTDIIIGKYVEPGSEQALTDLEIYNPPLTAKQITVNVITANSANSLASSANTVASNAKNSIAYYNRSCQVGNSSNTQTQLWRKFASYTEAGANADPYIILDVLSSGDMSNLNRQGRLKAHLRTGSTKGTVTASESKLTWLYRGDGMDASDFVMIYKATSGTNVLIELWCRCPTSWIGYRFYQVAEGDRINVATSAKWTLHDDWSAEGSDSYTSGYTVVESTDASTPMITNINQSGITVHPADSDLNRVGIDANGVELFKNNVSVAKYAETARIGRSNKARFEMGSSSLKAYDDNNAQYFEVSASGVKWGASLGSTAATTAALNSEINQRKAIYAKSTTAAGTAAKVTESGTPAGFVLYTGASLSVTFTTANTSTTPTLNVNGTGAKTIKGYSGAALTEAEYKWAAGATIGFTYDGTYWRMQDGGALQAKADAASSASTAGSKATAAANSATAAANSATAASGSATTAGNKATAAADSATAAAGSASAASSSASTASSKATAASNSATAAANSASAAADSASTASDKATAASNSATAAANSATEAANRDSAFFGTCGTAAGTQAKVVVCTNFKSTNLKTGTRIDVRCSTAQTYVAAKITLNVNSTGAKDVYAGGAVTSATNFVFWAANSVVTFVYNGSQWEVMQDNTHWSGSCTTAAGTQAKAGTINGRGMVVFKGTVASLAMSNANTHASPTLNVGSTVARNLYIPGATTFPTISNGYSWFAGATVDFVFDGQFWRLVIPESAKFATAMTSNGLMVHKQADTTTGVQITDQVDIVKSGNSVASFQADKIELGKNSNASIIELCSGEGAISVDLEGGTYRGTNLTMHSARGARVEWVGDGSSGQNKGQRAWVSASYSTTNSDRYGSVDLYAIDTAASTFDHYASISVDGPQYNGTTVMVPAKIMMHNFRVQLYNNTGSGTNGTVTLAYSATLFNHMRFYIKGNDGHCSSVDVYDPDGKVVELAIIESTANASVNYKRRSVTISDKTVTTQSYGEMDGNGTPASTNHVYIYRVEGWSES